MNTLIPSPTPAPPELSTLAARALASCRSRATVASYQRAYRAYAAWLETAGHPPFCRATVQTYIQAMLARNLSAASINLALSALKLLAREASDSGAMPPGEAAAIETIKGIPARGRRAGNWLSHDQAQALLDAPRITTLVGLRDRATLALLIGAALRREEATALEIHQLQRVTVKDGSRWALVDVARKHHRTQTIPLPNWARTCVSAWIEAAGLTEGRILRALTARGEILDRMSSQNVWLIVDRYARQTGVTVSPHDLRRTVATLELHAGASHEKIRQQLGHASIATTERYLKGISELESPACDLLLFRGSPL